MDDNQNLNPIAPDFSDIPALGDTQGLEAYLNNQALAAQGLPVQEPTQPAATEQPAATPAAPAATPAQPAQPVAQPTQPAQPADNNTITLTRDQFNAILSNRGQAPTSVQPQQPVQKAPSYNAQEQAFIVRALQQGYSLDQINQFLKTQKSGTGAGQDTALAQRIAQVEQYLRTQEYKQAEAAFVDKISNFGTKWGLSEQDLVNFGNEALKHGINIATDSIDLEMVFRAVYPDQYAIRSRRMTPTNSSQIYGGTSMSEGNRVSASKIEDAYVDNFLKQAMPNQYGMLNKK